MSILSLALIVFLLLAIAAHWSNLDNDATTSPNALNRFQLPKCPTYETNLKALLNRF
ncbi:MAG: hypothetical protein KME55_16725 [Nostoc indistinguendum CM1-VF10]|nr:hypothetical protein [Nostoc indistinguendum CM1-VF10]